jgi:hypothetical protein
MSDLTFIFLFLIRSLRRLSTLACSAAISSSLNRRKRNTKEFKVRALRCRVRLAAPLSAVIARMPPMMPGIMHKIPSIIYWET